MKTKKKNCLICDRPTKNYTYICDDCYSIFSPKVERVLRKFHYVDEAFSCFFYNSLIKETLTQYKFSNKRYFSKLFTELLIEEIFLKGLHKKVDNIVSVPIHRETKIERGFNQIELLEDEIEKEIGLRPIKNNLVKFRQTKEQARLNESERKTNLISSFKVQRPEEIKGKTILLLDDMITTGSTVEECGKVLKEAGALKVIVLSIATSH